MTSQGIHLAIDEYIVNRCYRPAVLWIALAALAVFGVFSSLYLTAVAGLIAVDQLGYKMLITTKKIVTLRGALFRRAKSISLNHLASMQLVNYGVPFLMELGTITLKTHSGETHRFHFISNPEEKVRHLDFLYPGKELSSASKAVHRIRQTRDRLKNSI